MPKRKLQTTSDEKSLALHTYSLLEYVCGSVYECMSVCGSVWVCASLFDATWSCPADNGPRNGMQIKMCHELGNECGRLQVPRPGGECDLNTSSWHSNRKRRNRSRTRRGRARGYRTVVMPKSNHNWKLLMNHKSVKSYVLLTTINTPSSDRRLDKHCLDRTNPRLDPCKGEGTVVVPTANKRLACCVNWT